MRCLKSLYVLRGRAFFECRCIREADAAPAIFSNVKAEWTPEKQHEAFWGSAALFLECSESPRPSWEASALRVQRTERGTLVVARGESTALTPETWKVVI